MIKFIKEDVEVLPYENYDYRLSGGDYADAVHITLVVYPKIDQSEILNEIYNIMLQSGFTPSKISNFVQPLPFREVTDHRSITKTLIMFDSGGSISSM